MNTTRVGDVQKSRVGRRLLAVGIGAFSLLSAASGLKAEVILQSNPSFNVASTPIGETNPGPHRQLAVGITTGSTAWTFDSMVAQIRTGDPDFAEDQAIFGGIYSDAGGEPGLLYASFIPIDVEPHVLSVTLTFQTTDPVSLEANTTYWFFLDSTGKEASWMIPAPETAPVTFAGVSYVDTQLSPDGGATWQPAITNVDVSINATAIPEPSTSALIAIGSVVGIRSLRRRKFSV